MTALAVAVVDAAVTRSLRLAVLRDGAQDVPAPGDGPGAVHLALLDGDDVVGAGAILPEPCPERPGLSPAWQLRGMAVAPAARGAGLGSALVVAAIDEAARRGGVLLWCNARDTAISLYRRHGFVVDGDGFPGINGVPHHAMWRELVHAPTSSEQAGRQSGA